MKQTSFLKKGFNMARLPSHGKPVDVKKCLELYNSGLSINEVGRRLGHHHAVIKYHLVRHNIKIRSQRESQRKPVSSEKIAQMYKSGISAVEIASELNLTYQCIYDRLAEVGVKTRSRKEQIEVMKKRGRYNISRGENHKNWNGGITVDTSGYRLININGKYIREHRYVWENNNGPLPNSWIIHHLNGKKLDNRIENLAAMPRKSHSPKSIIEPFRKRIFELEQEIKKLKKRTG